MTEGSSVGLENGVRNNPTINSRNWLQRMGDGTNKFLLRLGVSLGGQFGTNTAAAALGTGIALGGKELYEKLQQPGASLSKVFDQTKDSLARSGQNLSRDAEKTFKDVTSNSKQWLEKNNNQANQLFDNLSSTLGDIFHKVSNTVTDSINYVVSLFTGQSDFVQSISPALTSFNQAVTPALPVISLGLIAGSLALRLGHRK